MSAAETRAADPRASAALWHHLEHNTYPPIGATAEHVKIAQRVIAAFAEGEPERVVAYHHGPGTPGVTASEVCDAWRLEGFCADGDEVAP